MLSKLYEKYNPSTLSGAMDIIMVEHPDGSLKSSPWHLRFGKLGLIHHTNKVITIIINDVTAPFYMYVDQFGRGQFFSSQSVKENPKDESVAYPTKTLPSMDLSPNDVRDILKSKTEKRIRRNRNSFHGDFIYRNSAVDLEAAFEFEDPDPLPMTTTKQSVDLVQTVKSQNIDADLTLEDMPIPSSILLHLIRPLLNFGSNRISYTVSSLIQGPKTTTCSLYLWKSDSKIVISDIDGTVTKSDLLGHVLPTLGRDWTKPGVAELYTKVASFGVQFLYLTSRPIGEAPLTRKTLDRVSQDGTQLPEGPIITAPDRMIRSLTREVVLRKPHTFKIPTLAMVSGLFGHSPYVFGFGNRITDVMSYTQNGLPESQIILFDTSNRVFDHDMKELYGSIPELTPHIDEFFKDAGII